jgi:hypothetical protein
MSAQWEGRAAFVVPNKVVGNHALNLRQTHAMVGDALQLTCRREV